MKATPGNSDAPRRGNSSPVTRDLPPFLARLLNECPRTGDGVHSWLFRVSRQLHPHFKSREIFDLLKERVRNCGRSVPEAEIWSAVKNSADCAWKPNGHMTAPVTSKWPGRDQKRVAQIESTGVGLYDLWESSPLRFEDDENRAEFLIDQLFPGNPLLCVAVRTPADAETLARESWRGRLAGCSLIVPSPMSASTGTTLDGKTSPRCLSNVGRRRFLVVEFDSGELDGQAARLWHLASMAPLTAVVHSGGKSLHGWFYCDGQRDEFLHKFMRYAVAIGADPATWTPCQLVRLPDGQRDTGAPQRCYYFNPKTIKEK